MLHRCLRYDLTVRVRDSPIAISRLAIDLGGSVADVQGEVLRLALRLAILPGHQVAGVSGPFATTG